MRQKEKTNRRTIGEKKDMNERRYTVLTVEPTTLPSLAVGEPVT
jgi:hypothetical protein